MKKNRIRGGVGLFALLLGLLFALNTVEARASSLTIEKLPIERHAGESVDYVRDTTYRLYYIQSSPMSEAERHRIFDELKSMSRYELEKKYKLTGLSEPTNSSGLTGLNVEKAGEYFLIEDKDRYIEVDGNQYMSAPMLISVRSDEKIKVKPMEKPEDPPDDSDESDVPDEPGESDTPDRPNGPDTPRPRFPNTPRTGDLDLGPILIILLVSSIFLMILKKKESKDESLEETKK